MKQILLRFKSYAEVSRGLGVNYKTVTKWAERDSLPGKYDLRLVELAKEKGITLSLSEIAEIRLGASGFSEKPQNQKQTVSGVET